MSSQGSLKEGIRKDKSQRQSQEIQLKGKVTTEASASTVRRCHAASLKKEKCQFGMEPRSTGSQPLEGRKGKETGLS